MKTKLRNAMLVAFGIAGAVCVFGPSGEAAKSPSVATKADRLPVALNSGAKYFTVQSRSPGVSSLCRLPIQITNPKLALVRPSRCN